MYKAKAIHNTVSYIFYFIAKKKQLMEQQIGRLVSNENNHSLSLLFYFYHQQSLIKFKFIKNM